MPSGGHNIKEDVVYFSVTPYFGVAAFEQRDVDSVEERGSRMRAVGIVSLKYIKLHSHLDFLKVQVQHQIDHSGDYAALESYFHQQKTSLEMTRWNSIIPSISEELTLPDLKVLHKFLACWDDTLRLTEHLLDRLGIPLVAFPSLCSILEFRFLLYGNTLCFRSAFYSIHLRQLKSPVIMVTYRNKEALAGSNALIVDSYSLLYELACRARHPILL
jgi:hypothetical protein